MQIIYFKTNKTFKHNITQYIGNKTKQTVGGSNRKHKREHIKLMLIMVYNSIS